jgi:hypothetical protein
MTTSNTAGRGLAIAAGAILATGTLAILFEDVLMHGAAFTLKHWLTLVTVAGTMMVGHLADLARRHRHWMSVAGFTALFLAGTGLVVYSSVGRQAEKTMISSEEHDKNVGERQKLEADRAADAASAKKYRAEADTECQSGEGKKCRSARASRDFYDNSLKGLDARIKMLEPAKPVSAEAEQFATVAAALGYDKDQVRALAILLAPFFTTLFLEFGTIVSFGFAFSPKRQAKQLIGKPDELRKGSEQTDFPELSDVELLELRDGFSSELPEPKGPNGGTTVTVLPKRPKGPNDPNSRLTRAEVLTDLMVRNATGRGFGSQEEAAKHYGLSPSRFSEWSKAWEAQGAIPKRRMVGRCKMIEA